MCDLIFQSVMFFFFNQNCCDTAFFASVHLLQDEHKHSMKYISYVSYLNFIIE